MVSGLGFRGISREQGNIRGFIGKWKRNWTLRHYSRVYIDLVGNEGIYYTRLYMLYTTLFPANHQQSRFGSHYLRVNLLPSKHIVVLNGLEP